MRRAKGPPARVDHGDGVTGSRAATLDDVARENPGMAARHPIRRLAVDSNGVHRGAGHASAWSRAIRCSVAGCVENSRIMLCPLKGLMMNM